MMATIIMPEGAISTTVLPVDVERRLECLQDIVGGPVEGIPLPDGRYLFLSENGKDGPHLVNTMATAIAHEAESIQKSDYIAGTAVILPSEALE
jgi:hypothetical protein